MKNENSRLGIDLSDEHAYVSFFIEGYRPNVYSVFGEIDNSDILDGSFSYLLHDIGEWGAGEFSIKKESVHRIADQLRAFIHSDQTAVHIDEELRIDITKNKGKFILTFSMNNQLDADYVTVRKMLPYRDMYRAVLKPLYAISEKYP